MDIPALLAKCQMVKLSFNYFIKVVNGRSLQILQKSFLLGMRFFYMDNELYIFPYS